MWHLGCDTMDQDERRYFMERTEVIETSLGDLVVALSEETALYIHDKEEATKWSPICSRIY